uniref:Phosphohydrolase n=1 Tax=Ectopseudomonas mendocina (strain ymp) TaxID=399739 RepID=A4XZH2_ECTM1
MSWIITRTGKRFDLLEPAAHMVDPTDIAHALSMQCRFNGHVKSFYSVAQHCLVVAELVPVQYQLEALLHDATEAYVGDLVSPLKQALPEYRQIEMRVWHAICHRFDIEPVLPPCVHDGDLIALATEKRDLMPAHADAWPCLVGTHPAQFRIKPMTQAEAAQAYFNRLMELLATTHRARAAA